MHITTSVINNDHHYYYFKPLVNIKGVSKIRYQMENGVTNNLGSELKQNCRATKLKCAEIKICLRDHRPNEL